MIGNISKSKGFKGDKGDKGDGLRYEDLTPEQIESLKGEPGEVGSTPDITFRYDEETGMLYCSSDGVKADKEYINSNNLITKDEARGYIAESVSEVTEGIVESELAEAKASGEFDGKDGDDGVSCTHSWNGTTLTITSKNGTSSADLKGAKGDPGDKGDSYILTDDDKTEIADLMLSKIPISYGDGIEYPIDEVV